MKIWLRLGIYFILIAATAMTLIGIISYQKGKSSLREEAFNRLTAVREMKAGQIEDYFGFIQDQVTTLSKDPSTVQALREFTKSFVTVRSDLGVNERKMMQVDAELNAYFENIYLKKLNQNLDRKIYLATEQSPDPNCRILQHLYMVKNPYEVGAKDQLDSSSDNSTYSKVHYQWHPFFREFQNKFGYYDVFLVDARTGNIVYTVFKEVDYGTSLINGPFASTNLARCYQEIISKQNDTSFHYSIVDYEPYHPSYGEDAAFIGAPVQSGDSTIGAVIFQMPIDKINDVMTSKEGWEKTGLGKTGETYLVGEDFTLRNQSRFLIEDSARYFEMIAALGTDAAVIRKIRNVHSTIGLQEVRTEGTREALAGKTDTRIFPDYRGVPVLSAYRPLHIPGLNWVIMSEIDEEEAFASIYALRRLIIVASVVMLFLLLAVSYITSRGISKPLSILSYDAMELAKGNFDVEIEIRRKDEIGVLAMSFRKMQQSIRKLIDELRFINQNLENKVDERTKELSEQKVLIEEKNREVLDSINYAKRLQHAILPENEDRKKAFGEHFILYKPKDIVSGDVFWMHREPGLILFACIDCTGHGVPGAMVSMVGINCLERCVNEFELKKPSDILEKLSDLVSNAFETENYEVRDGMDISLIALHCDSLAGKDTVRFEFAGAHHPVWIVPNGENEIEEIKGDKQPIGKYEYRKPFTNHEMHLKKGDAVYLFTDGYADQFGGQLGKKLKTSNFRQLLSIHASKGMKEQEEILDTTFENWRGPLEQNDDICVIGLRIGNKG